MAPRLHLHIGPHKTGTTSIQKFLGAASDRALADKLFRYPPQVRIENVVGLHRPFQIDETSEYTPELWNSILATMASDDVVNIISAEGLSLLADAQIRIVKNVLEDFETSIAVTVRPQPSWLQSMYIQQLKQGKAPRTFAAHVTHQLATEAGDITRLVERWEAHFSPTAISVLPLVDPTDQRSLEVRFMTDLLGNIPDWLAAEETEVANPAPTPKELALLRHLANSLPGNIDWWDFNRVYFPAVRAFAHRQRWDKTERANFLTPELVRRIEGHFSQSNERLCSKYLNGNHLAMKQKAPPSKVTDLHAELSELSAIELSAFSIHLIERMRNGKLTLP